MDGESGLKEQIKILQFDFAKILPHCVHQRRCVFLFALPVLM
jgi:hypothetical protein